MMIHIKESRIGREKSMNLPNRLTMARIVFTLFMIAFILLPGKAFAWLSFVMYGVASLTDAADGHIARARNLVTNFGKFMDPLADKILNYSVMVLLLPEGLIPPVALVLILFREFMVSGIRLSAAEQGVVIAANIWGKIKTTFQDVSLVVILVLRAVGVTFLPTLSNVLLWICAALTVVSGVIYLVQNVGVLKEE